ncbi:MAG: LytTR family DNA-binding domain-containing protein [Acutalibacteraceae bacterium]|nr:LytTR family DNA-binding domain-containing protein [Acutalibacteraceae bacterium]
MNIGVCDDNLLDREIVSDLLEEYFNEKGIVYNIYNYLSGADLIYDIQDGKSIDMIFLDIYIGNELGINIARKLREEINFNGQIVFLTSTVDFAIEGYEVDAIGYLLKPIAIEKLYMIMDKAIQKYNVGIYRIKQRKNIITIKFEDIIYVESSNSRCILHSNKGNYILYKRLNNIEAELRDKRFLRCHQSYLVNMDYIKNANKQFELVNSEFVCIRQRSLKAIRQEYITYLNSKST